MSSQASAPKVEKAPNSEGSKRLARFDKHIVIIVLILAIGILLRAIEFGELPAGLYHDEAWNGIDAAESLEGKWSIFYPNNFGREPLFIWLTALSIKFLGHTPTAIRLPAFLMGVLTLPVCYLLARELFGRRIASWSLAVVAFTVWPIHLSRVGFRVVGFPLFMGLAIWQVVRGYKTGHLRHWIMGGLLYGITFYTYSVARFAPIAIVVFLLYLLLTQRSYLNRSLLYNGIILGVVCLITLLPLAAYIIAHPESFLQRPSQISIFNPKISTDGILPHFIKSVAKTLGMFNFHGDFQLRHNVPNRPVFDIIIGIVFLIGCYESFRRLGHAKYALLLIWVTVMLGPTILSEDAPHFLRAAGIWPIVAILPALGLERIWQIIERRGGVPRASMVIGAIICANMLTTIYDYFVQYAHTEEVKYWFEDAGLQLSHDVDVFLESGWTRGAVHVSEKPARTDRRVYVDLQLWKDWLNSHFLIPESPALVVPGTNERSGDADQAPVSTQLYAWWDPNYPGFWLPEIEWLPRNSRIEMGKGPLATTYASPEPHPAYISFTATPYKEEPVSLAHFESGVELVESDVQWLDEQLQVRLAWLARQAVPLDYTIFVHIEQDGNIVAQYDDGPMGGCYPMVGCLPMTYWRSGDVLVDQLEFTLPRAWQPQHDSIWVGMYYWEDLKRLQVTSEELTIAEGRLQVFPGSATP